MKIKITKIYRSDKNKKGEPFINKYGNAYQRIAIQTDKHDDKWVGGFGDDTTGKWDIGDEVNIDIEKDGDWLNFKIAKEISNDLADLMDRVTLLEREVKSLGSAKPAQNNPVDNSPNDIDLSEVPF